MNQNEILAQKIVYCDRICNQLAYSHGWIAQEKIDAQWVRNLDLDAAKKERVSAFCARFGRMQDYFSDKLLKSWVEAVGENSGNALQNFSVAERSGILTIKSEDAPALRMLRNALTHDYIDNCEFFAGKLTEAIAVTPRYFEMFERLKQYSANHLGVEINPI